MLETLRQRLRTRARAWKWRKVYPILLPHFSLDDDGLVDVQGIREPLSPAVGRALRMCDGTRRLGKVVKESRIDTSEILQLRDEGKVVFWPRPLKEVTPKDWAYCVIVSPHPDDAALSVASRLLADNAVVLDVFSRAAWWRFSGTTDVETISSLRLAEEKLVARMAGAELRMLGLPEALLRGHEMADVFKAGVSEKDAGMAEAIEKAIGELAEKYSPYFWYLPLGVGSHIDHRIARDAAFGKLRELNIAMNRIYFYEELPYAAEARDGADYSRMIEGVKLKRGWTPVWLELKMELNRVYWSQFTPSRLKVLEEYANRGGVGTEGEWMWQVVKEKPAK